MHIKKCGNGLPLTYSTSLRPTYDSVTISDRNRTCAFPDLSPSRSCELLVNCPHVATLVLACPQLSFLLVKNPSGVTWSRWLDLNQRPPTSKVGRLNQADLHLDIKFWCPRSDSNRHAFALASKASVSAISPPGHLVGNEVIETSLAASETAVLPLDEFPTKLGAP